MNMRLRQLEQIVLALVGFAVTVAGVVVLQVARVPLAVRVGVAVPLIATGATSCWAATLGWPGGEPDDRRESPALLLPVERVFLAPIAALAALGFVALVRDRDLAVAVRVTLALSTAALSALLVGLVLGRVRLPSRHLGRQEPGPPRPRRSES